MSYHVSKYSLIFSLVILSAGCKKLIDVNPPDTGINTGNVFTNDAAAISAVTALYTKMSQANITFRNFPNFSSTSLFHGLAADELILFNAADLTLRPYFLNDLSSQYNGTSSSWSGYYSLIYLANSAIEGVDNSISLTSTVKQQLLGEAKFVRAFIYFYLVNLYGDLPLPLSTDYRLNTGLGREPVTKVFEQIVKDLKDAQTLLSPSFVAGDVVNFTEDRIRPNRWAATAMLARTYLYAKDFLNAELEASKVIENHDLFDITTVPLDDVFLKNSNETIWALQPVGTNITANTGEGRLFILPSQGPDNFQFPVYLSNHLIDQFETGDLRKTHWIDTLEVRDNSGNLQGVYSFPFKYKIGAGVNAATQEYVVVIRLAEMFLIRAEAKAEQGKLVEAAEDVNVIRSRAGLAGIGISDQQQLINDILHERQVELFTEWGHRWFDLKRRDLLDNLMPQVAQEKGGTWQNYKALEPIPQEELEISPGIAGHQNPGYN